MIPSRKAVFLVTLGPALVLAGCIGGDEDGGSPGAATATTTAGVTAPPATRIAPGATAIPGQLEAQLKADLARRPGVPGGQASVILYREVTCPDGCLGVYRPDSLCTQALVKGWLAVLRDAAGKEYRYHGAGDAIVVASFEANARIGDPLR